MVTQSTILVEKKGRMAKITLNRPQVLNAINSDLRRALSAALNDLEQDESIDVIVFTGAGRAFCAGADLKELGQSAEAMTPFPSLWDKIRNFEKPTIAAVNGPAVTGGFELALSCDIIVASENAKFADTHARVGIFPGGGVTQILPRLVGTKRAKELSLTGNFIEAQEAFQLGLVNKVVPAEQLDSTVENLAKNIMANDQTIVRKIKRVIDQGEGMTLEDSIRLEQFEQLCSRFSTSPHDVERRRQQVLERGRAQLNKE